MILLLLPLRCPAQLHLAQPPTGLSNHGLDDHQEAEEEDE